MRTILTDPNELLIAALRHVQEGNYEAAGGLTDTLTPREMSRALDHLELLLDIVPRARRKLPKSAKPLSWPYARNSARPDTVTLPLDGEKLQKAHERMLWRKWNESNPAPFRTSAISTMKHTPSPRGPI